MKSRRADRVSETETDRGGELKERCRKARRKKEKEEGRE